MSSKLGPIEIQCDAPPYPIVQACHMIGVRRPEDTRWCRMSQFRHYGANGRDGQSVWHLSLGLGRQERTACTCGQSLPRMEEYAFTYVTGEEVSYRLGQCTKCDTVFWD